MISQDKELLRINQQSEQRQRERDALERELIGLKSRNENERKSLEDRHARAEKIKEDLIERIDNEIQGLKEDYSQRSKQIAQENKPK